MADTNREIGTIWKEEPRYDRHGQWKIQMPRGILTTTTLLEASMWSAHVLWNIDPSSETLRDSYLKAKSAFNAHQTKVYNKRKGLS